MIVEKLKSVFDLKMGCGQPSKHSKNQKNPSKQSDKGQKSKDDGQNSNVQVLSVQKYDEIFVNVLYKDLREAPEWFVLNNMLMSVQFFENYQR